MLRTILPIFLISASAGIFYFFSDPTYQEIKRLGVEKKSYEDALENSKRLQVLRDQLLEKYNSFPASELERLERMLPNNVDNVRLVLEVDRIAARYGMSIKNIRTGTGSERSQERTLIGREDKPYDTFSLEFSIDGPYSNFVSFVSDLEKSLRIVDIENITFSSSDDRVSSYTVRIKTYWLK